MKKLNILLILTFMCVFAVQAQAGESRIGGGATYWVAVDDIDGEGLDDSGLTYYASYQYWLGMLGLEADLEFIPNKYGEDTFAPQAFVLFGKAIYAGAGIGIEYRDGDFAKEPFFALRGGLNLEILPAIYWDIYALYRFNDSAELDNDETDIDSDTVFLGTAVRIAF